MKFNHIVLIFITLFSFNQTRAQKVENLIIITLDGMRWQEVFSGADTVILKNKNFTKDSSGTNSAFNGSTAIERRQKLFPFFWNTIANKGILLGNRWQNNKINNANEYQFSYPGYNEIFTGYPDTLVNSNDKVWNKNINVLEFIKQQKGYEDKIAVFTTWDVFPYILNTSRNNIYVNADVDTLKFNTPNLQLINDMQFLTTKPVGVRPDVFTYFAAREYLKNYRPKVLYIAFDETDDFAHAGEYDQYLKSAHAQDAMIADLWNYIQSIDQYKNNTTLILTCDHGRGDIEKDNWQHHGKKIEEAGEVWIAAIGNNINPLGEVKVQQQFYQEQLAATFAKLLGFNFTANHPIAEPLAILFKKKN
jgi:Type I phosphodiesterase / nucleotide pyrophosphatase